MSDVTLRPYAPRDRAWLVERHQTLYAAEEGFDATFGPLVRQILLDFETSHDPVRERGWIAQQDGTPLGSIFCVARDAEVAKLRLFLLVPQARGLGVGKLLLRACMGFAQDAGYGGMVLWTHESHDVACALYAKFGWILQSSKPVRSFGVDLVEQVWRIDF